LVDFNRVGRACPGLLGVPLPAGWLSLRVKQFDEPTGFHEQRQFRDQTI